MNEKTWQSLNVGDVIIRCEDKTVWKIESLWTSAEALRYFGVVHGIYRMTAIAERFWKLPAVRRRSRKGKK